MGLPENDMKESVSAEVREALFGDKPPLDTLMSVSKTVGQIEAMIAWRLYRPASGLDTVAEERFRGLVNAAFYLRWQHEHPLKYDVVEVESMIAEAMVRSVTNKLRRLIEDG